MPEPVGATSEERSERCGQAAGSHHRGGLPLTILNAPWLIALPLPTAKHHFILPPLCSKHLILMLPLQPAVLGGKAGVSVST